MTDASVQFQRLCGLLPRLKNPVPALPCGQRCARFVQEVAALTLLVLLTACAGMQAFQEGNQLLLEGKTDQGLAKLEEAVKLAPKNAEYRIALATRRTSVINRLIAAGEAARREGRLTDAEKLYRQVQDMEPEHAMARQGLQALALERRHRLSVAEAQEFFKKGKVADLHAALEKLRSILSENPGQKDALSLRAQVQDALAKQLRPEAKLAATFRKPISLEFRDAPLKSILEVVAKVSGLNFFYDKEIRPDLKATIFAKNTTIEDAMRVLLVTNQLEQKVLNDNSLLIYPGTPQKLKEYQTLAVRSFYLANADVKAVSNTIKTILKTKDVVIDERLGVIIMRDTPEAIRMAERIVALQDLSDPEVMLEVEILEIKRSRLMELGVQWPGQATLSPLQMGTAKLTLDDLRYLTWRESTTVGTGNILINARKEDQNANILANPRIRVRNKEKAKVQIGDRVPVITTTSTSTGFVSESVSYVDVGLKLEVEPSIYLDEEVAIKVSLEVSNLVREIVSKSGTLSYQIGTRGASTVLRLRDGETQILAGLINDEDRTTANKVPGLGELPIAGRLFGSQKDDTQRSEILLSITPRMVRSIQRPDMLSAEFESGTESSVGAPTLRLSTPEEPPAGAAEPAPAPAPTGLPPAASASPPAGPDAAQTAGNGAPAGAGTGAVVLAWQAPTQVKVGEQFSAVLRVNSQQALRGMPLLVAFDPQALQVASVQEGDFFMQGNAQTSFSQRVDPAQGKVFVALVRQNTAGDQAGINGSGALITLNLKAVKPGNVKLQLLSATPEPAGAAPLRMPLEHALRVLP
ncbi:cohesin domain-containing protein [Verminephrobacter aporrectodeae]|uniref:cohesin domain-containing protein n=1 Tax=Verminephrobacter aporrectodeae TaxID=1110389 RepID=UPI002237B327|nr:cohesin domain-containing protein [Verminephrobacter aporrectodeae]